MRNFGHFKGNETRVLIARNVHRVLDVYALQQEIATVNLGKFRKLQHELEEAETRAMLAEKSLSQLRAMSRQSTTSVTESVTVRPSYCRARKCIKQF